MKKRDKSYNPINKFNPVVQAQKLDLLTKQIEKLQSMYDAISKANDTHIAQLGNFAKHDIKNAIQSMDSILLTTDPNEFDEEKIVSLTTHLDLIRTVMDNFAKVIPHSPDGKFTISTLLVAIELLNRAEMSSNNIKIEFIYDRTSAVQIRMPFQDIIMIVNNLLLNSITSVHSISLKKIKVEGSVLEDTFTIKVLDSGIEIDKINIEKVFDYGFTTTSGSGVGLYHAKFLCENFKGNIVLLNEKEEDYTKAFLITLPTSK